MKFIQLINVEMPTIVRDGFFYPILELIMDSFSCSPLNTSFCIGKNMKKTLRIMNMLRCDMVTSFKHYNDITDRRAAVRFLSFPRAGPRGVLSIFLHT